MFELSLYTKLKNDAELTDILSVYKDFPSVFSNSVPENVDFPYLVFSIAGTGGVDSAADTFEVRVTLYDYKYTGKRLRLALRRVVELLDRQHLQDEYLDTIRFFRTGYDIEEGEDTEDPRTQFIKIKFKARAGRKGWMQNTL